MISLGWKFAFKPYICECCNKIKIFSRFKTYEKEYFDTYWKTGYGWYDAKVCRKCFHIIVGGKPLDYMNKDVMNEVITAIERREEI